MVVEGETVVAVDGEGEQHREKNWRDGPREGGHRSRKPVQLPPPFLRRCVVDGHREAQVILTWGRQGAPMEQVTGVGVKRQLTARNPAERSSDM